MANKVILVGITIVIIAAVVVVLLLSSSYDSYKTIAATGKIITLASRQYGVTGILIDSNNNIYWYAMPNNYSVAGNTSGTIMEYNPSTKEITTLASVQGDSPSITIDSNNNLYWTANSLCDPSECAGNTSIIYNGTIMEHDQSTKTITTLVSHQDNPIEIAISQNNNIYWISSNSSCVSVSTNPYYDSPWGNNCIVMRYNPSTRMVTTISPGKVGINQGDLVIAPNNNVYWEVANNIINDTIMEYSPSTGKTTIIASDQYTPSSIATDSNSNVYWTNYNDGKVMKYNSSTKTITTLTSGQDDPAYIAIDSHNNIYWVDYNIPGTVKEYNQSTGAITTLYSGQYYLGGIAISSNNNVYWTSFANNGTVMEYNSSSKAIISIASGPCTNTLQTLGPQGECEPSGITIDSNNNIYWVDGGNGTVMAYTP